MQLQRNAQSAYNEGTLYLAIKAIQAALPNSTRHALKAFNNPKQRWENNATERSHDAIVSLTQRT
jgi:hypothetical protein